MSKQYSLHVATVQKKKKAGLLLASDSMGNLCYSGINSTHNAIEIALGEAECYCISIILLMLLILNSTVIHAITNTNLMFVIFI